MVINYWAAWCGPCLREIPELNLLDEKDSVAVFAVNFDDAPLQSQEMAFSQAKEAGIRYSVLTGRPDKKYGYEIPRVLPTSVIISPSGKVEKIVMGEQTANSLLTSIEQIASGK